MGLDMNPTSLVKDEKVCHSGKPDEEATSLKNIPPALLPAVHHYWRKTKNYELWGGWYVMLYYIREWIN